MNHRNLIPVARLASKRRSRAVRRWLIINAAYLLALGSAGTACIVTAYAGDNRAEASAAAAAENLSPRLAALRKEAVTSRASRQSAAEVSSPPDWSILLTALAASLGDDVVLSGIDSAAAGVAADKSHVIRLGGIGRSSQAVAEFVLRVERMQFFTRVQLVQTAPQTLQGRASVGFQLVCTLPEPNGGQ